MMKLFGFRNHFKDVWRRLRHFDYKDLRFLYLACLVTVAVVFSWFQFMQHSIQADENALIARMKELEPRAAESPEASRAMKDTLVNLGARRRDDATLDAIQYVSLLVLMALQAILIFRPAIARMNASLSTRADFLSRISHEIRNPMNSIIGMADILKTTRLNYEQLQYVDNLLRSGHALLEMLNNLIDFSSIEGRKLVLKSEPFDLFQSLDRCLHLIALQAHHKNLNVYVRLSPGVVRLVRGDSVRLEQVLINLLNNAVKFTEQGKISLSVRQVEEEDSSVTLQFAVEDTGIGIQQEQMSQIFGSFVQGDSSIQRRYGGSGLGLSIANELIRLMGGDIRVTSRLGEGSRFFFCIHLEKQRGEDALASPAPLRELTNREFIFLTEAKEIPAYRNVLRTLNVPARILSGVGELQSTLTEASGKVHEIIIDDSIGIISMITCRNLADQHGLADQTVALLRSNFTKENMDLLRRNGYSRFLIKPLRPWEMLDLPTRAENEGHSAAANSSLIERLKARNLRLLLVDDSNDNLFLLKEVVQPIAASIHFAENGLDALDKFRDNSFDVVFMDIQMPVMDGYTAIRKMRQMEPSNHSIPIYAVTAHAGLVDAQKCREAGFTDRIVKPVRRADIYNSLAKFFGLKIGEFDSGGGDHDASFLPAKYLKRLMPVYLKTRFEDMDKLNLALEAQDWKAVLQIGHKIKGSSASYGFPDVSARARDLEDAARAGHFERCRQLSLELTGLFEEQKRKQAGEIISPI